MQRLLIAGSEHLRDSIVPTLSEAGYETKCAFDDLDLLLLLKQDASFDLVLGDLQIPKTLGILRSEYPDVAVVIVAERGTMEACVQAIRHGAVNYLTAPVDPDALLASVDEALTYPHSAFRNGSNTLQVRELTIDRRQSKACFRQTPLQLTTKEFEILNRLMEDAGRVVSLDAIVYSLHGERVTRGEARQMISAHLTNLRAKLHDAGCEHYLVNSYGRGYYIETNVEETLRQTEERMRLLLEQLPGNVWTTDTDLRFTWVAGARAQAPGLTPDQIIGMPVADLLEDGPEAISMISHRQALEGESASFEREWRGRYYQGHVEPLRDPDGSIIGCIGVSLDISERKRAEERSAFQANVLSQVSDVVIAVDMGGRLTYWNHAAERWFGLKLEAVAGRTLREVFHDQWLTPEDEERMTRGLWANGSWHGELATKNRDGQHADIEISISWLKDSAGNSIGILTLMRDITQRKQAEEALRASELRFRSTFEQAAVGVTHTDPDGKWLRINQKMCDILGYSREELFELNWQMITHPDDLTISLERTARLLSGEIETYSLEKRYIRKDGSPIWVNLTSSPVRESSGAPQYYVAVIEDITERKRAEALLRENEFRYRSIFENALEGIYRSVPGRRLIDVNPAMARMLGYESPAEVMALNIPDELFVDLAEWEHLQALHRAQDVIEGVELRWRRKDGEPLVVGLYVQTLRDEDGQVMFYEGIVTNITERKRAEEALRQSEERYRIISEMMSDYVYAVRVLPGDTYETSLEWVAGALESITGYTVEEALSGIEWAEHIHPDDMPLINQRRQALLAGDQTISEFRMLNKQGETYWLRAYNQPIWDEAEGRVVRIYAAVQDITERKQIEEALVTERNRLQTIIETVPDQIYVKNLDSEFTLVNRRTWELHRLSSDHLLGKTDVDIFGEEGKADLLAERELFATGKPIINEERFTPEALGGPRWSLVTKVPLYDADKKVIGLVGINRDITERKRIEEALRQSEERYRIISETMSDYVYAFRIEPDRRLALEWITGAYERITGYTVEEVFQGAASTNVIHPEDQALVAERTERLLSGQSDITECRLITRNGEIRYIRLYGSPVWDEVEKRLIRVYASAQDITERKRVEEALRESEANLRKMVENAPAPMMIFRGTKVIFVNEAIEALSGYTRDEWLTMNFYDVIVSEQQPIAIEKALKRQRGEQVRSRYEVKIIHKNGREIWIDYMATAIQFEGETAVLAIVADITRHKQMEQTLRQSEAAVRALIESIPAPLLIFDDHMMLYVNPAAAALIGYTPEEVCQMTYWEVIHPDMREYVRESGAKRLQGEPIPSRYEVKLLTKMGETVWVDYMGTVIQYEGKPAVLGIVFDITGRKQTEEALWQSDERFRIVLQNMPIMVDAFDEHGNIVFWNRECELVTGYSAEEISGNPSAMQLLYPNPTYLTEHLAEWKQRGDSFRDWEWEVAAKDGSTKTIAWSNISAQFPVPGWKTWGIGVDVTTRRDAQQALRQSEEHLRDVIANAPVLVWAVDRDGIFTLFQGRGIEALGLESHQIVGRSIYESNRHDVQQHIERAFAGQIFTATVEIYDVVFDTHYAPIYDAGGAIIGIMGISITGRG